AWRTKTAPKGKIKDAEPHAAWKLDLYQSPGKPTIDRAKLDANRNGKWDDKYTFDGETITLELAPADDEHYTQRYHWNGSGWTLVQERSQLRRRFTVPCCGQQVARREHEEARGADSLTNFIHKRERALVREADELIAALTSSDLVRVCVAC